MAADFSFRRLPSELGWLLVDSKVYVDSHDIGIEVVIRAGEEEPAPALRALVERALADIHALVGRAKGYLDCFVDRQRLPMAPERAVDGLPREWYFEGIEAGLPGTAETDHWFRFSLDADLYGNWMVRLSERDLVGHIGWYILELRRVQF